MRGHSATRKSSKPPLLTRRAAQTKMASRTPISLPPPPHPPPPPPPPPHPPTPWPDRLAAAGGQPKPRPRKAVVHPRKGYKIQAELRAKRRAWTCGFGETGAIPKSSRRGEGTVASAKCVLRQLVSPGTQVIAFVSTSNGCRRTM